MVKKKIFAKGGPWPNGPPKYATVYTWYLQFVNGYPHIFQVHVINWAIHDIVRCVCRGSIMVTTSDFHPVAWVRFRVESLFYLWGSIVALDSGLIRAFIPAGQYIGTSLAEHQSYDWVCIDWISYPEFMCLQFGVDDYLLRVLGWALTDYGDNLQSLLATRLEK